ncbi:hypothetical protein V1509DRAFT_666292 [Lipomyces kononenkoae]
MPPDTPHLQSPVLQRETSKYTSDDPQASASLPTSPIPPPLPSTPTSPTPKSDKKPVNRQISCELSKDPYSKLLQYYETYLPPRRKQGRWVDSPNGEKTVWVADRFSMASTSSMISNLSDDLERSLIDGASECQGSISVSERFSTGNLPINIRIIPPSPAPSIRNSSTGVGRNRSTRSTRSTRSIRSNRRIRAVGESPTLSPINSDCVSLSNHQPNGNSDQFLLSPTPLDWRHAASGNVDEIDNTGTVRQHITPVNGYSREDSSATYLTVQQHPDDQSPDTAANSSRYESSMWDSAIRTTVSDLRARPSRSTRPSDDRTIDKNELNDDANRYRCVYHSCNGEIVVSDLDEESDSDAYHNTLRYTTDSSIGENFNILGEARALVRQTASANTGSRSRHSIGPESRRDRIIQESVSSSPSRSHSSRRRERKFSSSSVLSTVSSLSSSSISNTGKLPWKKIWGRKSY